MGSVAVFINSCDKYNFTWEGLKYFYNKYWNWDIGWSVYCGTEEEEFDFGRVKNLRLGKRPFGEFIISAMDAIEEPYIFLQMDDHWPLKRLDTALLKESLNYTKTHGVQRFGFYFNYHPRQRPDIKMKNLCGHLFYKLTHNSKYLACLQPSLWPKSIIQEIIEPNWSPWNFEKDGTYKMRKLGYTNVYYVIKDNWYREAYAGGHHNNLQKNSEDYKLISKEFDY